MAVPFKNRLQRYHKESLDTLFRTLQFKQGVQRYSSSAGSSYLTTTVTVTAAEFIATTTPGDVVKNLLPSPGAGKFILINSIMVKFKDATVAFDNGPQYNANLFSFGLPNLVTTPDIVTYVSGVSTKVNESIDLKLQFGTAPTTGDGNLIFEIEYQILDI